MGAADAIPGVSGGTIALITGIYQRLIGAITTIDLDQLRRIVSGFRSRNRTDAVAALWELDLGFLLALGAGVLTAVVTILHVFHDLLAGVPVGTYGFVFGLIGASAVVLYREVSLETRGQKTAAVAGFLVAFSSQDTQRRPPTHRFSLSFSLAQLRSARWYYQAFPAHCYW